MQTTLYPQGPANVPSEIANPSKSFKKHIWIASAALILFMATYMGLSFWFLYKSFKLFSNVGDRDTFLSILGGLILGFLGVFMIKALFFRTKNDNSDSIEVKQEDEPELFNFINKIADDAKAPRPHKIFLTSAVNACVFYDVSIINLIFPIKKNLEIGLGLVNTLNIGEFKAVVAHEFGHFTQKSMIIGRWVYVAHRVAQQIVGKRDIFDTFLNGLSSIDIRIAWVGWILSIFIWAIRSIADTLFTLVLITQRALSREMEFHADLVAVSLTGSDSIVNSLHKLQTADEAYEKAIEFVDKQLSDKKAVSDIFAIQSNSIKHMAVVLNDPAYGQTPVPKESDGQGKKFMVFKEQLAQAPKMWSTHPSNIDREKNAKKIYIASQVDERSSWLLFKDPAAIKNKTTLVLYRNLKIETTPLSTEESIALHDEEFQRKFFHPKYRGVYLNRSILLKYGEIGWAYNMNIAEEQLAHQFSLLYPESIQYQLSVLRNLEDEVIMLEGLNNKTLTTNQSKINYRDREINRKELPTVIEQAKKEAALEREKIEAHDYLCRNLHYTAAKKMGKGWAPYLISVANVIHFCEHTKKNIEAHTKYFYETIAVATRIKNISAHEIAQIIGAANNLGGAIESVFSKGVKIELSQSIINKMGGKKFEAYLEPFNLGLADQENINSWIQVVPGWIDLANRSIHILHEAALDELLQTEEYIMSMYDSSVESIKQAPEPIGINNDYLTYNPNLKWEVTQKLDLYSKFYNGDGVFHTIGRLAVAASVILFAVFLSASIGDTQVIIYNGLPISVAVHIDDKNVIVSHDESVEIAIDNESSVDIETTTLDGEPIESFTGDIKSSSGTYMYNVANAAVIYSWTAHYGNSNMSYLGGEPDNDFAIMGTQRWMQVKADYYFEDPPTSISLSRGESGSKKVIMRYLAHPSQLITLLAEDADKNNFVKMHAIYEDAHSTNILSWLALASSLPDFSEIIKKRLALNPNEIVTLRSEQDFCTPEEKKEVCKRHEDLYRSNSNNADMYYLHCRCIENETARDSAFLTGYKKWPNNTWLAFAAGSCFIQNEAWNDAISCYSFVNENELSLKEFVLEEMKRMYHLTGDDELMPTGRDILIPNLLYVESAENSVEGNTENTGDYSYAYKLLEQGRITEALTYSAPDSTLYYMILRLAAVSDNTNDEIVNKALALNANQGFNNTTFAPTLALLTKEKLPLKDYEESLRLAQGAGTDTLFTFIDLVKQNKIAEADRILKSLSAEMKGKFSLLGLLILDDKAPYKWNQYASKLLFITEKPYRLDEISI